MATLLFPGSAGAEITLFVQQPCTAAGQHLELSWENGDPAAFESWLDISVEDPTWEAGAYLAFGPNPPSVSRISVSRETVGIESTQLFIRISERLPDDTWASSPTFQVAIEECATDMSIDLQPLYSSQLPQDDDLNCQDLGFEVIIDDHDPHGLDADGNGIGCQGTFPGPDCGYYEDCNGRASRN